MLPRAAGIGPLKRFSVRIRVSSRRKRPKDGGISPEKLLPSRLRYLK